MNYFRLFIRSLIILVIAFCLGLVFGYVRAIRQPLPITEPLTITIEEGEGPRLIAQKLIKQSILDNERPLFVYILAMGKRNMFYPGVYELPTQASIVDIVRILTSGKKDHVVIRIKEGSRITDIAIEIQKKLGISASDIIAVAPVENFEGYLFPDTYYFAKEATAQSVVKTMRDNFNTKTSTLELTKEDVILASIVEREAANDSERATIAGLYQNRLAIGMALQADPTVQYAKGSWEAISVADYSNVISPYNSYLHQGLPPTPIASASLASLKAVKSPEKSDYYYFFHTKDGQTIFSKTGAEHTANKAKFLR